MKIKINGLYGYAVSKCVLSDALRSALTGITIEKHSEKGAYLVGTDGHCLLCVYDEFAEFEGSPGDSIILSNIFEGRKREWVDSFVEINTEANISITVKTKRKTIILEDARLIQETPVKWKSAMPSIYKGVNFNFSSHGFNLLLINRLVNAINKLNNDKSRYNFIKCQYHQENQEKPLVIIGEKKWFGIVMPCREVIPNLDWFKK